MAVERLLEDLKRSHDGLQHLHLEATEGNLNIVLDALTTLKAAYAVISSLTEVAKEEKEKEEPGDGDA